MAIWLSGVAMWLNIARIARLAVPQLLVVPKCRASWIFRACACVNWSQSLGPGLLVAYEYNAYCQPISKFIIIWSIGTNKLQIRDTYAAVPSQ